MAAPDLVQRLWGAPGQANRVLRLHTALGRDTLVAERLDGVESVDDGGFRLHVVALSPDAGLPLDQLPGTPALVELLTADSRTDLRPFHGHVTTVEREGSNGGLARYRLTLEPWLALLRSRQDSYVFHDATVIEIVEQVFGHYGHGVVLPAWRWELADRSLYRQRSLTSQYQESDFAFVSRILAEEGIFYWFEHVGDVASPSLGAHTLVLADANTAFHADAAVRVRYHRSDATEQCDTIQRWEPERRWQTGRVARASWDYRTLSMRPAGAEANDPAVPADDDDTAGPYAWADAAQGEQRARQHLDARHVTSSLTRGAGSARRLAPARSFILTGHPTGTADPMVCLRVEHHARNNLDAEVASAIEQSLGVPLANGDPDAGPDRTAASGPIAFPRVQEKAIAGRLGIIGAGVKEPDTDFYANTFTALPVARTYRPRTADGHGLRRHPRPTASGPQSAIVTSNAERIHTDRDHRVIVQQHWQRGGNAASRLDHPRAPDAPADAGAGSWVRVMTPLAGANWGSALLPRAGQEVWLNYLEGDIDRPVIVAGLYNGQGNEDARGNRQAGGPSNATGNAPAWFTGNGHPGVLSGIKTQDLAASAIGTGGWRQLQFDDTPGQGHAQLATTDYATALTLGHVKQLEGNARLADRGYGAELATQAQGALRGGAGLLVSSARGADQMDAADAVGVLDQATQQMQGLAEVARQQQAGLPGESAADRLNAVAGQAGLAQELAATRDGHAAGPRIGGGEGSATGWSQPHLVAHGRDGLIAVTPGDAVWVSGMDTAMAAVQDLDWIAQGQWSAVAAHGIALYAQGSQSAPDRPVAQTGLALAAASGSTRVEAQQDQAGFAAEKAVMVSSSEASVAVQATGHVRLTAAGAYLKLEGADIEIGAPGDAFFKGALRELAGPQSADPMQVTLPTLGSNDEQFVIRDETTGRALPMEPYRILGSKGELLAQGWTDREGRTARVWTRDPKAIQLLHGFDIDDKGAG